MYFLHTNKTNIRFYERPDPDTMYFRPLSIHIEGSAALRKTPADRYTRGGFNS